VSFVPFEIIRDPAAMRARAEDLRRDGRKIAVVPTMGALHEGHLALLRAARAKCDVLILTIFVNPTQFGPNEDLAKYPRDEAGDLAKARACGIDLAFCPDASAMYPAGAQTFVEVRELQQPLCGARRPGHFAGVATIVAKLFNITKPHVAVFGEKDYQQFLVIRRMTLDLAIPVEVIGAATVRASDGLALSSRNRYLSAEERARAPVIYQSLTRAVERLREGERDFAAIENEGLQALRGAGMPPDYFSVRNAANLDEPVAGDKLVVLTAARLGRARLIDNIRV
jgi:pantoate--beta-alanine ligase